MAMIFALVMAIIWAVVIYGVQRVSERRDPNWFLSEARRAKVVLTTKNQTVKQGLPRRSDV